MKSKELNTPKLVEREKHVSLHKSQREKLADFNRSFLDFMASQNSITSSSLSMSVNDSAGNSNFDDCYKKKKLLGQGGFADVHRCKHRRRKNLYAVKEIFYDSYENHVESVREEIKAMKRLCDGCYIIRLLDVFREPERTYLIMEEMRGGDLLERLYKKTIYSESEARRLSRRLLEAVRYCHKKNIAHRDIKPENILLVSPESDTDIRLGDFGCARIMTGPKCMRTLCGSTCYAAPELYMHEDGYDERCDLWSLGIVMFIILGGYAPFDGDDADMPAIVCAGDYSFHWTYWKEISDSAKNCIRGFLKVDPNERATLEETLDSDWLRRRDVESLDLSGSVSTFDAWVRRQNQSSQSIDWDDSYAAIDKDGKKKIIGAEIGETEDDHSEGSLSIGDL